MLKSNTKIIYEDNHLIAVVKPQGILTQPSKKNQASMYSIVKQYIKKKYHKPGNVYLGILHRLDRNVSGILLFAKTSKSASRLNQQFRDHSIEKKYFAIVEGHIKIGEDKILTNYIKKDPKTNKVKIILCPKIGYQKAILHYKAIKLSHYHSGLLSLPSTTSNHSLLSINLITGRSHQIRAQLSFIGHPIVGDTKYGSNILLPKKHLSLCSYYLSFDHPTTKKRITLKLI